MDSGNANAFGLSSPPAGSTIMDGNLSGLTPAQFNSVIQPQVPAMKTLTAPMPTTLQDDYRYYRSSISDCGIHRTDGKRISFTSHFFRTNIQEDIMFLDNELRSTPLVRNQPCRYGEVLLQKRRNCCPLPEVG